MIENWIQCIALEQEHTTNIANISQRLLYSLHCPARVGTTASFIITGGILSLSGLNSEGT
jgi:hypothetical protein